VHEVVQILNLGDEVVVQLELGELLERTQVLDLADVLEAVRDGEGIAELGRGALRRDGLLREASYLRMRKGNRGSVVPIFGYPREGRA
jgi:hypothetical protein